MCPDAHDVNNLYTWSNGIGDSVGSRGTAFYGFLPDLNTAPGFAGHSNWRLPTLSEWQTILVGPGVFSSSFLDPAAGTNPTGQATECSPGAMLGGVCIATGFAANGGLPAKNSGAYWSSTSVEYDPQTFNPELTFAYAISLFAGYVFPGDGTSHAYPKTSSNFVRAVRTGSCGFQAADPA